MSKPLNMFLVEGHVGADPITRTSQANKEITSVVIYQNFRWKDKEGKDQERTNRFRFAAYGKVGEIIQKHVKKGRHLRIHGEVRTNVYKQGEENRYSTDLVCNEFSFLDFPEKAAETTATQVEQQVAAEVDTALANENWDEQS